MDKVVIRVGRQLDGYTFRLDPRSRAKIADSLPGPLPASVDSYCALNGGPACTKRNFDVGDSKQRLISPWTRRAKWILPIW